MPGEPIPGKQGIIKLESSTTELIKAKLAGPERTFEDIRDRDLGQGITFDMLEASLRERGVSGDRIEAFRRSSLDWISRIDTEKKNTQSRLRLINGAQATATGFVLGATISSALLGDASLIHNLGVIAAGVVLANVEILGANIWLKKIRRQE